MKNTHKTCKSYGSRKEEASYLNRYKKMNTNSSKLSLTLSMKPSSEWNKNEIFERSQKIIGLCQQKNDISNIKIEDDISQEQIMQSEFLQTEIMWFQKLNQVNGEIQKVKENTSSEQKLIKQLQKELNSRKNKLKEMQKKVNIASRNSQETAAESYEERANSAQQEYDRFLTQNEEELQSLKIDRDQIVHQNYSIELQINHLKQQIQSLSKYDNQTNNLNINLLMEQQQILREQVAKLDQENIKFQQNLREIQIRKPLNEEVHRKYLQLYEKIFINRQLDKFQQLMQIKQQEMYRLEQYERRKSTFKDRKKEVDNRQKRVQQKNRLIQKLTEQIKEKSTILLNLYQYQQPKGR